MIHNRTVLWKYHDSDQVSSQKQCEDLLQLAPWFPSFDEWEQKLPHLSDVIPVSLTNFRGEEGHPIVLYPQITDVLEESKDVVRHAWIEDASNERHFSYLKSLPRPYQQMTRDLYSEGKNFLYGMLYTKIFELQIPSQQLVFGQNTSYSATNRVPFSIAVHSRHTVGADDGSYIEAETKCLNKMITHLKDTEQSCKVFVMSDRSKTIDLLIEWLFARNCTTMVANHTMGPKIHDIAEHGPWSGAGFLLDLQLVGAAESGVVGDRHRSSTALVIYQVDYNRRMRACGRAQKTKLHDMPICNLPNKHLSGYNYGPGTPTFRHHSHLALLEPIAVVDTYKKKDLKNYVISRFDFERPSIKTVYDALNSKYEHRTHIVLFLLAVELTLAAFQRFPLGNNDKSVVCSPG
ncbi:unnamed protein product [Cylindrotheca closterium]|uniref:Uncharacterized protein n=1 Tax=Cylindrotheca closterium TaxID=2856 RepID=A0AAD2CPX3_9STRA|nr:unnamed protein product [Cylindrotheca closterium]